MRPGYLFGEQSYSPKHFGFIDKITGGGKSAFEPPPAPPPGAPPQPTTPLAHAYNKVTKAFYKQDNSCPEGERMQMCNDSTHQPVGGCGPVPECCDIIFGPPFCMQDCGPPTPTGECDDDPNYVEFPEGPFRSCDQAKAAFAAKGIPVGFAQAICDDEDLPTAAQAAKIRATATARRPAGSSPRNSKGGCQSETQLEIIVCPVPMGSYGMDQPVKHPSLPVIVIFLERVLSARARQFHPVSVARHQNIKNV